MTRDPLQHGSYRFPPRGLPARGEELRGWLGAALRGAAAEGRVEPLVEITQQLRVAASLGEASLVFAALAQPFSDDAGYNALTFLLARHTSGHPATRAALDAVMRLHESLHADTTLAGHLDTLWWAVDPGHGNAVDMARQGGDAVVVTRLGGGAWMGGVGEGLRWVFDDARVGRVGQASFDSGARFLMNWLYQGSFSDTAALVLQRVPGVAGGRDELGRGLAETAALRFLEDDIWAERMEALCGALCERGISDEEAGILCVAGMHAVRSRGPEGQGCGRRMLAMLEEGRSKDWRGSLLEAAVATGRLPCSEAADRNIELGHVWACELGAWTPDALPARAAEVVEAILAHRGVRLDLVSSHLLGKQLHARGDWSAWLPQLPAHCWLGRVLSTCANNYTSFADSYPGAERWWLMPDFLGPALRELPEEARRAWLTDLEKFAPAALARLDAVRLGQGTASSRARRLA